MVPSELIKLVARVNRLLAYNTVYDHVRVSVALARLAAFVMENGLQPGLMTNLITPMIAAVENDEKHIAKQLVGELSIAVINLLADMPKLTEFTRNQGVFARVLSERNKLPPPAAAAAAPQTETDAPPPLSSPSPPPTVTTTTTTTTTTTLPQPPAPAATPSRSASVSSAVAPSRSSSISTTITPSRSASVSSAAARGNPPHGGSSSIVRRNTTTGGSSSAAAAAAAPMIVERTLVMPEEAMEIARAAGGRPPPKLLRKADFTKPELIHLEQLASRHNGGIGGQRLFMAEFPGRVGMEEGQIDPVRLENYLKDAMKRYPKH